MSRSVPPRVPATPIVFGPVDGELAGFYHAPHGQWADARAVLLCPSIGHEYVSANRTFRVLAEHLAANGHAVLRFDYYGTGDSAGTDRGGGLVARWLDDVVTAAEELRTRSGIGALSLAGLRIGGTLAALASERAGAEALVLWDACVTGRGYVREIRALHRMRFPNGTEPESGEVESAGFVLSAETATALGELSLLSLTAAPAPRVLLAERSDRAPATALAQRLESLGAVVERRSLRDSGELAQGAMHSRLPEEAVRQIVGWLPSPRAAGESLPPPRLERPGAVLRAASDDGAPVTETPVRFGDGDRLYGVRVERSGGADPALPPILLPNTGADHHIGPHRLWTALARRWAARGFRVLRFDISGLGESLPGPSGGEQVAYAPEAVDDLRAAAEHVRDADGPPPVAIGICTGGYFAVQAVLAGVELTECIAVNPQFYWYEEGLVDAMALHAYNDLRRYPTSMLTWAKWRRLLLGKTSIAMVAAQLATGAQIALARRRRRRLAFPSTNDMLTALADTGVPTLFIFGDADRGWLHVQSHAAPAVRLLRQSPAVAIEEIRAADHTFMLRWCQQVLAERLTDRLTSRHRPARETSAL